MHDQVRLRLPDRLLPFLLRGAELRLLRLVDVALLWLLLLEAVDADERAEELHAQPAALPTEDDLQGTGAEEEPHGGAKGNGKEEGRR